MSEKKADVAVDLRNVRCPMNYVKAKLQLESMQKGQVLELLLSDGEAVVNVPRSVKEDGHRILSVKKVDEHYSVTIERT